MIVVPVINGHKKCSGCKRDVPVSQFNKYSRSATGLQSRCRSCMSDYIKKWEAENPILSKGRQDRHRRSEKRDVYIKAWRAKNKELVSLYARSYYARKMGAEGSHTILDVLEILEKQEKRCAVCQCELFKYHVDHIIPVSIGGSDDKSNLQMLCVSCNTSKGAKTHEEFIRYRVKLAI